MIFGYIDPGAGTLIVQMFIASCVGAVAMFRRTIFGFFGKKSAPVETPAPADNQGPRSTDAQAK